MRLATSRALAVTGIAGMLVLGVLVGPALFGGIDLQVYDVLGQTFRDVEPSGPATIVAIDDASLAAYGRWPWPRALLADLIDRINVMGASAIALDVLFAEPEHPPARLAEALGTGDLPASGDARLADALSRARAVTSYAFVFPPAHAVEPCRPRTVAIVERRRGLAPLLEQLSPATGAVCGIGSVEAGAAGAGFLNSMADADGLIRRTPLLIAYDGHVYPSLALAAAQRATGGAPIVIEPGASGGLDIRVGGRRIQADAGGHILLRYANARAQVSAGDVLAGRASPDLVRGRVVLVGPTAVGIGDTVATPHDDALAGVEIHAAALDGLLTGRLNRRPFTPIGEVVGALLAGTAALAVSRSLGHLWGALAAGATIGAAWVAAGMLLARTGAYISPLYAVVAVAGCLLVETGRAVGRERRRKQAAQRLIVRTLASLTETRNPETGRHARRTEEYARLLTTAVAGRPGYRRLLTPERIELIATLAPLHDIGKVGVSDAVLNKRAPLDPGEVAEMRRHPELGHQSLLQAERLARVHDDEVLALAKEIVYTHHERWDGTGYPRGLKGPEIPIAGRIVALVDVYDALVMDRPYRRALPHAQAVAIVTDGRGTHFDPNVVDAFLGLGRAFEVLATRTDLSGFTPPRVDAGRARARLDRARTSDDRLG